MTPNGKSRPHDIIARRMSSSYAPLVQVRSQIRRAPAMTDMPEAVPAISD
jgi:hypothetical protein